MAKRKVQNEGFLFSEVPEGDSPEVFADAWYLTAFGQSKGFIDTEKLYWKLHSWSESKGEKRLNWIAEARTFYLSNPQQYNIPGNGKQLSKSTEQFITAANTAEHIIQSRGVADFIPAHLRNNGGGN